MAYRVSFSPEADAELAGLLTWLAPRAGIEVAFAFVDGLRRYCLGLADFPERGRLRDDLRPALRTLGYRRRVTIAFHVTGTDVIVDRILYGSRDVEGLLSEP